MKLRAHLWTTFDNAQRERIDVGEAVLKLNDAFGAAYEQLKTFSVGLQKTKKKQLELRQNEITCVLAEFPSLVDHFAKTLKVFGDVPKIPPGCPDRCSGRSNDDAARKMVDAVRLMGWNNLSDTGKTIDSIWRPGVDMGSIRSMTDLQGMLHHGNVECYPYALPGFTKLIRSYPQMSFYYKLDPKHLDVLLPLHFLLMTALKGAFAAPDDKQPPGWKLVTPDEACFGEDATKPAFAAYKNLLGIPMPEFVLDHWKQTLKEQAATPMDTTPP
eukprot:GHVS01049986.1.p1 GENE.GHVS01049986.1~~GHVS01049986.1.p1  ORF type:complete len:271 (-),score=25.74 GHVS01049986.1:348-1160(-)